MNPMPANATLRQAATDAPSRLLAAICSALLLTGSLACGAMEPSDDPESLSLQSQELESANGLAANGLSANGLSANGLSANGLSANGLSANGLSQLSFTSWFQQEPAQRDMLMRYLVRCAVPAGQVRTYTDAQTQHTYTWQGNLGLAPGWSSGQPATLAEQQLVSACLAAHVNKFGVSVSISVLGLDTQGQLIPFSVDEIQRYSRKEACFFGNLFTGEGVHVGNDRGTLSARQSSARMCTLSSSTDDERTVGCAPLVYVGSCTRYCTLDATKTFYTSCRYNDVTYRPLTTRLREEDIYSCGDGTCQVTESCGTSSQYNNCQLDCGKCQ
jgi:hypothetical protein